MTPKTVLGSKVLLPLLSPDGRYIDQVEAQDLVVSPEHSDTTFVSFEGYKVELFGSPWVLSRDVRIRMDWFQAGLSDCMRDSALLVLKSYAIDGSAAHVMNLVSRFQHFTQSVSKGTALERVTANDLINYRSTLGKDHEWYLGVLSGFFKRWAALRLKGVDDDAIQFLESIRIKGNKKGVAVQTMCPNKGPLSELENEALDQRLLTAFEYDEIDLRDFVLVTIFKATGRRPLQLGDLKCKDLIEGRSQDGLKEYLLNIPRRKQRATHWREEFKPFPLVPEIGLCVRALIEENIERLKLLGIAASRTFHEELPIFPNWNAIELAVTESITSIEDLGATEAFHMKSRSLAVRLEAIVKSLLVPSERTGGPVRLFPLRLRRSLASRLAREGYGPMVIAECLDHSDDQNAWVYTENVPEHAEAIDKAVARTLAPLAQAFAGVLVDTEAAATRGDDRTSRVRTDTGDSAGTCGHYGFCGALAPVACYTCRYFQPWLDGPHEEVLETLITERDRVVKMTQDKAIAAVNDRTIYAVTEVILRCEKRRIEFVTEHAHG